jgi:uncharacterized membrane protein YoaK (UPF0700 family)
MIKAFADIRDTLVPRREAAHGPLPLLLVFLTVVTGLVDAFSYLELSHVFVANMTGNVVFLSFALGGAAGFLWWASVLAVATFSLGAFVGGLVKARYGSHRGRHLLVAVAVQSAAVCAAFVVALLMTEPYEHVALVLLIALLGVAMGLQNATARALAVPDLSTTVLTLTITGISADSARAGGSGSRIGRRLVSVVSLFLGGLIGTLLVIAGAPEWTLLIATLLLAITTAAAWPAARSTAPWTAGR